MSDFKAFHQKWLERVNSPLDVKLIESLLKPHDLLVESSGKYYVTAEKRDQDSWFVYNGEPEAETKELNDKILVVAFNEPPEDSINVVVWDDEEISLPYSKIEYLLDDFNLDIEDLDSYFAVVPDVQNEIAKGHHPRYWFPFRKDGSIIWYMDVENDLYAAYDQEDNLNGFFIHDEEPPLKFTEKYAYGNDVEESDEENYQEESE